MSVIKFFFLYLQRRLGDAAKKAISKLQLRTIRKGDKVNDIPYTANHTYLTIFELHSTYFIWYIDVFKNALVCLFVYFFVLGD